MLVQFFLLLSSPVTWLLLAFIAGLIQDMRRPNKPDQTLPARRRRLPALTAEAALAFQFLSITYRPQHAYVKKAQIQQQEDADDDANGDPETPLRHLHRQLRRIRRGDPVDTLVWRLE